MKKGITIIVAVVLMTSAAGNLAAQTVTSPVAASSGRFTSAADDFISMIDWQGVNMGKWFGFASWAGNSTNNNAAVLGWAQKFGDLYVALEYNGTLWGNVPAFSSAEKDIEAWGPGTGFKSWKTYTSLPTLINGSNSPDNNIGVLIGVADMGFRLFFSSTYRSFSDKDFAVAPYGAGYVYTSYLTEDGIITPQIGWGMAKPLTGNGVQPWLTLDLAFHRNYIKQELAVQSGSTQGEEVTHSTNLFLPQLTIGLGGFTFYDQDNFNAALDLEYTGKLPFYDNEHSYPKGGKYETGKIKGFNSNGSLSENFAIQNNIAPMLKLGWASEDSRISLKSRLKLGVDIDSNRITSITLNPSTFVLEKSGTDIKNFTFAFTPKIQLAAQYQIIPEKLTISIGGTISAGLKIETVEIEQYANDKAVAHGKTKTTDTVFTGTTTSLGAAVAWNLTKNFWLEGSTGIQDGNSNHLLGNVIQFSSILAGLKF